MKMTIFLLFQNEIQQKYGNNDRSSSRPVGSVFASIVFGF